MAQLQYRSDIGGYRYLFDDGWWLYVLDDEFNKFWLSEVNGKLPEGMNLQQAMDIRGWNKESGIRLERSEDGEVLWKEYGEGPQFNHPAFNELGTIFSQAYHRVSRVNYWTLRAYRFKAGSSMLYSNERRVNSWFEFPEREFSDMTIQHCLYFYFLRDIGQGTDEAREHEVSLKAYLKVLQNTAKEEFRRVVDVVVRELYLSAKAREKGFDVSYVKKFIPWFEQWFGITL